MTAGSGRAVGKSSRFEGPDLVINTLEYMPPRVPAGDDEPSEGGGCA